MPSASELRALFTRHTLENLHRTIPRNSPIYEHNLNFALSRFEEGLQLASFLVPYFPKQSAVSSQQSVAHPPARYSVKVLDLGAGNGGVSLALATDPRYRVFAIDITPNPDFIAVRRASGMPIHQIVAAGEHLPFRNGWFDVVLCLETIEHVPEPRTVGREMMRVLRPGGLVMITTPARLKFLFRPDPHFGVPRLVARPDGMQRRVVVDKLRLTDHYDVTHIYWTVGGVVGNLPGPKRVKTLCNIPYPGIPSNLREWLWYGLRRLLWDRILVFKAVTSPPTHSVSGR